MSNTYTQIYIHSVFTVQNRISLVRSEWKDELYKYITGIVKNNGHKMIAINGMPDHIHIFIGLKPSQSVSLLMQNIKEHSSKWIKSKGFVKSAFKWQEGFGAFSYSISQIDSVVKYIHKQQFHHRKKTFIEEYRDILMKFGIEYDERYIFRPVEIE
jgi:putative transposase